MTFTTTITVETLTAVTADSAAARICETLSHHPGVAGWTVTRGDADAERERLADAMLAQFAQLAQRLNAAGRDTDAASRLAAQKNSDKALADAHGIIITSTGSAPTTPVSFAWSCSVCCSSGGGLTSADAARSHHALVADHPVWAGADAVNSQPAPSPTKPGSSAEPGRNTTPICPACDDGGGRCICGLSDDGAADNDDARDGC